MEGSDDDDDIEWEEGGFAEDSLQDAVDEEKEEDKQGMVVLVEDRDAQCEDILKIVRGKRKRKAPPKVQEKDKKRRVSSAPRQTKKQKEAAIEVHKAHLTCLLIHHLNINKFLEDDTVQASLLSLLPPDFGRTALRGDDADLVAEVKELAEWFYESFTITDEAKENEREKEKDPSDDEELSGFGNLQEGFGYVPLELATVIASRRGTDKQLYRLFVCLLRMLNIPTRYVVVLDPIAWKPAAPKKGSRPRQSPRKATKETPQKGKGKNSSDNNSKKTRGKRARTLKEEKVKEEQPKTPLSKGDKPLPAPEEVVTPPAGTKGRRSTRQQPKKEPQEEDDGEEDVKTPRMNRKRKREESPTVQVGEHHFSGIWAEVYSKAEGRWIHVDVLNKLLDKPSSYHKNAISYVVAFSEGSACLRDVTQRYVTRWSEALARRVQDQDWWAVTLGDLSDPSSPIFERDNADGEALRECELNEPFPTSLAAYKTHPLYCLEKFLHKYETLHPRTSLGEFKGLPIYPRSSVKMLHTLEKWLEKGRGIKTGEQPIKRVTKRQMRRKSSSSGSLSQLTESEPLDVDDSGTVTVTIAAVPSPDAPGAAASGSDTVGLYGEWQTESYKPAEAISGKVPRNQYGNVYLFTPEMLPAGTSHIDFPGVLTVAKRLGIDCAPAMVGWRYPGGRSVPDIRGGIVCEEYYDLLLEVCKDEEYRKQKAEEEKRKKEVVERWRSLAKKLLVRDYIARKYLAKETEQPLATEAEEGSPLSTTALGTTATTTLATRLPKQKPEQPDQHAHVFKETCVDEEQGLWLRECTLCALTITFEKM